MNKIKENAVARRKRKRINKLGNDRELTHPKQNRYTEGHISRAGNEPQ